VLVVARPAAAAVLDRAEVVLADVVRGDALEFGLRHLAELLGQRHLGDDPGDARFQHRVDGDGAFHARPVGQRCRSRGCRRVWAEDQAKGQADRQGDCGAAERDRHACLHIVYIVVCGVS
jgi:hypothetical protein